MCVIRQDIEIEKERQIWDEFIHLRQLEREHERLRGILADMQRLERVVQERIQRERDEEMRRIRSLRHALFRLNGGRDRESM